ncbi:MAG: sarcosine oxidase subunit gamma [Planktomarina sp.]|nr:sarcosine oxidase subunit gamma [Planktomarina sp.]
MHNLDAITALGSTVPRVDQHGPIKLIEEPSFAMATIAARKNGQRATKLAIRRIVGASAPKPGYFSGGTNTAFWMGPDQWMLEAPYNSHEMLFDLVKSEVKDQASVTEQSDGWCRFDMVGEGLASVLELLCPIDSNNFKSGHSIRTTIDHLGCFVICRELKHLSIIGPRSSAQSLHHTLLTAIKSAF